MCEKIVFFFLSCVVCSSVYARTGVNQENPAVSLEQVIQYAVNNSLQIQIEDSRLEAASASVESAKANYWPVVSMSAKTTDKLDSRYPGYSRTSDEYAQAGVNLQYTLLDFGRRYNNYEKSLHTEEGAEYSRQQKKQDVIFNAFQLYADVSRYRQIVDVSRENVSALEKLNALISEQTKAGMSSDSELVRSNLSITSAKNKLSNYDKKLKNAEDDLETLIGNNVKTKDLDDRILIRDAKFNKITESQLSDNLMLKYLKAQMNTSLSALEQIESDKYPTIDVIGSYKKPISSNIEGLGMNIYLQITYNLFDGGLTHSKINIAKSAKRESELQYESAKRDVTNSYKNLLSDINSTYETWKLSNDGIKEAEKTKSLYLDEFKLGTRSLNDLIQAEDDYAAQRITNLESFTNNILSVIALYNIAGRLDDGFRDYNLIPSSFTFERNNP